MLNVMDLSRIPDVWAKFAQLNFEGTRTWLFSAPGPRTMALLSFVSPLWLTNSGPARGVATSQPPTSITLFGFAPKGPVG